MEAAVDHPLGVLRLKLPRLGAARLYHPNNFEMGSSLSIGEED
jgi:hypothetical protein